LQLLEVPRALLEVPRALLEVLMFLRVSRFLWSEQITKAESSNPVPPLKSSGKRAVFFFFVFFGRERCNLTDTTPRGVA
jgi:hypothetical protein